MKLLAEINEQVEVLREGKGDDKKYYIKGVFMEAESGNRNGRFYPKAVLFNECRRYVKEYIEKRRSLSELGHPENPQINLERVSHIITELKESGNQIIGKAKILDTPYGKIAKNLIDEGVMFGTSSRGLGSLMPRGNGLQEVQDDFVLTAIDIVSDPSCAAAFVEGLMESKEWVIENGIFREKNIEFVEKAQKIVKAAPMAKLAETKEATFKAYLETVAENYRKGKSLKR